MGMKLAEPAFRDVHILFIVVVRNVQEVFLDAVRVIIHARIDAQETLVQADIGTGQDGGGDHFQEGVRILLDEQAGDRMVQIVFVVVQRFAPAVDAQRVKTVVFQGRATAGLRVFNLKAIPFAEQPVFVVEGEFDALSIIEAGGIAVALGSSSNLRFIEFLKSNRPKYPLILALDTDGVARI